MTHFEPFFSGLGSETAGGLLTLGWFGGSTETVSRVARIIVGSGAAAIGYEGAIAAQAIQYQDIERYRIFPRLGLESKRV